MLKIMPVSELKNYGKVLDQVSPDSPVFLTKNGYGRYAVVDLDDYAEFEAFLSKKKLISSIEHAKASGTQDLDAFRKELLG